METSNSTEGLAAEKVSPQQGELFSEQSSWHQILSEKLRTRLNAIVGFSELLALEPLSPNGRGDLKQILKAARDMLDVVDHELTNGLTTGAGEGAGVKPGRERTCDLLYIEDDVANVALVERILELRPEVSLKHAMFGQLGIEMVKAEKPKLVLLDLNLPDINGAEVLQVLQSTPETAAIPVVVLSANAMPTQIERLLAAGARNYLTKPFDLNQFLAVVDEWTGTAATAE